jgi:hypothetical protein
MIKALARKLGLVAGVVVLLGLAPVTQADDHWDDDWKISVSGKSKSAGSLSFTLTFEPADDGAAREAATVTVAIPEGTGANDMADLISAAFRGTLGDDQFHSEVDWGEHVKVKGKGDTPDFTVAIAQNTVQGLSLAIKED